MLYQTDMGFIDNSAFDRAQAARAFFGLSPLEPRFERHIVWTHNPGDPQLRPPAYTFFVAALYFILGDNQFGIRLTQMALGLCSALLGYLLGRQLRSHWTGVVMAAGLALYWPLIVYESVIHEPVLALFLSLVFLNTAVWWSRKPNISRAALTGMTCGLFTTSSAAIILFLPVLLGWAVWVGVCRANFFARRALRQTAVMFICFFIPLLPVTTLNYMESGKFVLNSFGQGITLHIGNQLGAKGYLMPADTLLDTYLGDAASDLRVDEKVALIDDWGRWAAMSRQAAFTVIRENPIWFLRLCARRALLFWTPHEISQNVTEYCDRLFSSVLIYLPGNFGVVFALSVMGLFYYSGYFLFEVRHLLRGKITGTSLRSSMHFDGYMLVFLLILTWYMPYLLLWVSAHFRIPLMPSLFAFAALGVCECLYAVKVQNRRSFVAGIVVSGLIMAVICMMPMSHADDVQSWLYFRVRYYQERGKPALAADIAQRVVERAPDHAFAQMTYANILRGLHDDVKALAHYERALALADDSIDVADVAENVGMIRRELGDNDGAETAFKRVLTLDSDRYAALHGLGNIAYERGNYGEAVRYLEQAVHVASDRSNTYFLLGLSLVAIGETDRARSSFRAGLRVDPNDIWILLALADLESGLSETDEACRLYEKALTIDPQNERARRAFDAICS